MHIKSKQILIFSILSILFIFSMFYRVTNAIIAPHLVKDFNLNAEELGILSGAFFWFFALSQIPMGPMLDRIGPRIIITIFMLIGASGAFVFAIGKSFITLLFGRILMGMGMASALMGGLKVLTLRFPSNRFSSLAGLFISIGTLGNILGATPLAYLDHIIGWRKVFIFASIITASFAFLTFWSLTGTGIVNMGSGTLSSQKKIGLFQSIQTIAGSLSFWQISAAAFFRYGTFISLQGLWLGLYLMDVKGYSSVQAGNVLIMLAIGQAVGSPVAGRLSDRASCSIKTVALLGLSLYCISLFPMAGVFKIEGIFWYTVICFCIGFFQGFGVLLYAHVKGLFPDNLSGTAMAWVNFFIVAGGAVIMSAIGSIIDYFPHTQQSYQPIAYHISFLICFISMAGSLVFYAFSKTKS